MATDMQRLARWGGSGPKNRKLIALGQYPNCSYVVSLPLSWVRKNKLRRKSPVVVETNDDNTLTIRVNKTD